MLNLVSQTSKVIGVVFLPLMLLACQTTTAPEAANVAAIEVDFSWAGTSSCFDSISPPFTVGNVPADTAELEFKMVDLNVPTYSHGGGTVAYDGQGSIPAGAFRYTGPCPPGTHIYQWTVTAKEASGAVIGRGQAQKSFPPSKS